MPLRIFDIPVWPPIATCSLFSDIFVREYRHAGRDQSEADDSWLMYVKWNRPATRHDRYRIGMCASATIANERWTHPHHRRKKSAIFARKIFLRKISFVLWFLVPIDPPPSPFKEFSNYFRTSFEWQLQYAIDLKKFWKNVKISCTKDFIFKIISK